jgi:hypothetical protein
VLALLGVADPARTRRRQNRLPETEILNSPLSKLSETERLKRKRNPQGRRVCPQGCRVCLAEDTYRICTLTI